MNHCYMFRSLVVLKETNALNKSHFPMTHKKYALFERLLFVFLLILTDYYIPLPDI